MSHLLVDPSGRVVNWIVIDEALPEGARFQLPEGHRLVPHDGQAGIDWIWDGAKFINPNPPKPMGDPQAGMNVVA